jgi:hypothetical protein
MRFDAQRIVNEFMRQKGIETLMVNRKKGVACAAKNEAVQQACPA